MIFKFIWHKNAEITLQEETFYILYKWNENEVNKFNILVEENLKRLSKNPEIGNYNKHLDAYFLVISKQTTMYYYFDKKLRTIEILLFWNNQKNPKDLIKLL